MKNAVIALLMAKSANAQKRKAGMEQDYDFPAPALIAAEWNDYKCTD